MEVWNTYKKNSYDYACNLTAVNSTIQKHFDILEETTKAILKEVSALSSRTYHERPQEGKWSISEILTHILTSEKMSLEYMKKKYQGVETLGDTGIREDLLFIVLKISQRLPMKYNVPPVVLAKTPTPLSYGDFVRQWHDTREEMLRFLEAVPERNIRKKLFRHPAVGMLGIEHAVRFMNEHLNHHRPQILRIVEAQKRKHLENLKP